MRCRTPIWRGWPACVAEVVFTAELYEISKSMISLDRPAPQDADFRLHAGRQVWASLDQREDVCAAVDSWRKSLSRFGRDAEKVGLASTAVSHFFPIVAGRKVVEAVYLGQEFSFWNNHRVHHGRLSLLGCPGRHRAATRSGSKDGGVFRKRDHCGHSAEPIPPWRGVHQVPRRR